MGSSMYERPPEENLFSRVPEGWIFTFGGTRSFLVNDAQRAELLARLGRWRFVPVVLFVSILAVLLALSGGLSRSGFPDWIHFGVYAATSALAALVFFKFILPRIRLFIVRPVLADAPPASPPPRARVGVWESVSLDIRRQAEIWSLRRLVLTCAAFGWFSVKSGHAAFASNGTYLDTAALVALTAYFGVVLWVKLRGRASHDQDHVGGSRRR
jgi:hypothetical protein